MKIVRNIAITILAILTVGAFLMVVPAAAWGFLLLFGIQYPFWKIFVGFILFSIVLDYVVSFFRPRIKIEKRGRWS